MQLGSLPYFLEQVLFMDSRQCRLSSGHPAHFHQLGLLKLWALPVDILGNTNAPANLSRFSECLRDTRQGLDGLPHTDTSHSWGLLSLSQLTHTKRLAPSLLTPPVGANI